MVREKKTKHIPLIFTDYIFRRIEGAKKNHKTPEGFRCLAQDSNTYVSEFSGTAFHKLYLFPSSGLKENIFRSQFGPYLTINNYY
jgi:hypothetical protein